LRIRQDAATSRCQRGCGFEKYSGCMTWCRGRVSWSSCAIPKSSGRKAKEHVCWTVSASSLECRVEVLRRSPTGSMATNCLTITSNAFSSAMCKGKSSHAPLTRSTGRPFGRAHGDALNWRPIYMMKSVQRRYVWRSQSRERPVNYPLGHRHFHRH